jgi:hypothetical protein
MSVRLKINVLRFRQLSIVVPLRCPAAGEDTMGRAGAQVRAKVRAKAVGEAVSDLTGRCGFERASAAAIDSTDGSTVPKNSRDVRVRFAVIRIVYDAASLAQLPEAALVVA